MWTRPNQHSRRRWNAAGAGARRPIACRPPPAQGLTVVASRSHADPAALDLPRVGVGMLGYAFMGKAHTNAFKKIPYLIYPPPANPQLIAICGRDESAVPKRQRVVFQRA